MSKHFMIFVIDDLTGSGTPEEMKNIDAFNDTLRAKGHWVFAGGMVAPSLGTVIDHRKGANISSRQALFNASENYSGFWLIKAETLEVATQLAFEGSLACNRKVELRPLLLACVNCMNFDRSNTELGATGIKPLGRGLKLNGKLFTF